MEKMNKSMHEMGEVFMNIGTWFMQVDPPFPIKMSRYYLKDSDGIVYDTGCFGAWLALKYDTERKDGKRLCLDGFCAFAEDLGFEESGGDKNIRWRTDEIRATHKALKRWAKENTDMWGNDYGEHMFSSPSAFDEGDEKYTDDTLDTLAVGKKLIAVGKRVQASSPQ